MRFLTVSDSGNVAREKGLFPSRSNELEALLYDFRNVKAYPHLIISKVSTGFYDITRHNTKHSAQKIMKSVSTTQ